MIIMMVPLMGVQRVHADTGSTVDSIGLTSANLGTSKMFCELLYTDASDGNPCIGIGGRLVKDTSETDANHDYYAIAVSAWVPNTPCDCSPKYLTVSDMTASIQFPNSNQLLAESPVSGTQAQQTVITLCDSGGGACVGLDSPSQTITATTDLSAPTTTTQKWHVSTSDNGKNIYNSGFNVAEFGVTINTPENAQFAVSLSITMRFSYDCGTFCRTTSTFFPASGTLYSNSAIISDYVITFSPTELAVCTNSANGDIVTVSSMNGFSGTVSFAATIDPTSYGAFAGPTSSQTSVTPSANGGTSIMVGINTITGSYKVTVTTTSGALSHTFAFSAISSQLPSACGGGGGGGGGSVAAGTLITMADGSKVPVESLQAGKQVMSYDMTLQRFETSTITCFFSVNVDNYMTFKTTSGLSLTTDQNPHQTLYVKYPDGTWSLVPVTQIKMGYYLFDAAKQDWVRIVSIGYHNGGQYVMYDIYTTNPGNYIANNILDPLKT